MDPRITLRDIIMFEALAKKSFMQFSSANADDLCTLLYVHDHSKYHQYTLDIFIKANRTMFNNNRMDKDVARFLKMAEADIKYINQFSTKSEESIEGNDEEPQRLTPAILKILYSGISPEWLMIQGMELLPVLSEGYKEMKKEQFAEQKFWSTLMVSPHVKKSAIDRLAKSIKNPWEENEQKQQISESLNTKIAHAVFGIFKKKE